MFVNISDTAATPYSSFSAFPSVAPMGSLALAQDTGTLYVFTGSAWESAAADGYITSIGPFSITPTAAGLTVSSGALSLTKADGTNPGGLSADAQTVGGVKTFSAAPIFSSVTASQALVVDGSKQLSSLAYGSSATASALVQRDSSKNTAIGNVYFVDYTANSGSAVTLDPANGKSQRITLTAASVTITAPPSPSSGDEKEILLEVIQDATGGRTLTFSGITWATSGGVAPAYNTASNASTYYFLRGTSIGWIGFPANQNIGVTDGSSAASGYIGEVITSSVPSGSAVSLTTGVASNVTSLPLPPGFYLAFANIIFDPAGSTVVSAITGSINSTSATQATAPNGGYQTRSDSFTTGADQSLSITPFIINITATTTYFLVATASFTTSTCAAFGEFTAVRIR
jgi:hypothetical protein